MSDAENVMLLLPVEKDDIMSFEGKWLQLESFYHMKYVRHRKSDIVFISHLRILDFLWICEIIPSYLSE